MNRIEIVLNKRRLYLYEGNRVINSFPVAIGKADTPTPTGTFTESRLDKTGNFFPLKER